MTLNVVRRKHPYCIWHTSSTRTPRAYSVVSYYLVSTVCTGRQVPWWSGMGTALTRHPFVSIPPPALVPHDSGTALHVLYSVRENRVWHSTDRGQVLLPTCPLFWGPKRSNRRPCQSKMPFPPFPSHHPRVPSHSRALS